MRVKYYKITQGLHFMLYLILRLVSSMHVVLGFPIGSAASDVCRLMNLEASLLRLLVLVCFTIEDFNDCVICEPRNFVSRFDCFKLVS